MVGLINSNPQLDTGCELKCLEFRSVVFHWAILTWRHRRKEAAPLDLNQLNTVAQTPVVARRLMSVVLDIVVDVAVVFLEGNVQSQQAEDRIKFTIVFILSYRVTFLFS